MLCVHKGVRILDMSGYASLRSSSLIVWWSEQASAHALTRQTTHKCQKERLNLNLNVYIYINVYVYANDGAQWVGDCG